MDMFTVDRFTGVNESADGKTELKMGEASVAVNWDITDGFNLKTRPGIERAKGWRTGGAVEASWSGFIGSEEYLVIIDYLFGADKITDRIFMYKGNPLTLWKEFDSVIAPPLVTDPNVRIFSFAGSLYILTSAQLFDEGKILRFNGEKWETVPPYDPVVITGAAPAGGGTLLEPANLLSINRRIEYNGDGASTQYWLPKEVETVKAVRVDNVNLIDGWAMRDGALEFYAESTPAKGVSNVEVTYSVKLADYQKARKLVERMKITEAYNGSTDTRLFMAGDGSNICIYSGVPLRGTLDQLYFPAGNEAAIDASASPVTGLIRHFSSLLVFKPDGVYTLNYQPVTLPDGNIIAGFYARPASRGLGSELLGEIQTVNNSPRTIAQGGIYDWRIASSINREERYAERISKKVEKTLSKVDYRQIVTCDDNETKTYYAFLNDAEGTVLVNRYALTKDGVWTIYKSPRFTHVYSAHSINGAIVFISDNEPFVLTESDYDAGAQIGSPGIPIKAYWESGYMSYGTDSREKYSEELYVSMKPEPSSSVFVSCETDRRSDYPSKEINAEGPAGIAPKIQRVRLKAKQFVYYKLKFSVTKPGANATILSYDQPIKFSSKAK